MTLARRIAETAVAGVFLSLALPASAQSGAATPPDAWAWRFALNGWFPSIHSSTQLSLPGGGNINSEADPGGYLSKLKFVFMGTLEARRGPWSFLADAVYLNLGDVQSQVRSITGPGGIVSIPIDTGTRSELKGYVTTFEGGYAVLQTPTARADVIAGLRYSSLKVKVDWDLSGPTGGLARTGGVEQTKDYLDGIVGVRGKTDLGGNWDFRYYLDGGAGSSRFTWQAVAGVGYRFGWGDVVAGYRHLAYDMRSERPISDIKFSGPQVVVGFTW